MKRLCRALIAALIVLFLFHIPAKAGNTSYVEDTYGVLSPDEISELNQLAAQVSDNYKCGVYVRVFPNMESYYQIEQFSEEVYQRENLGWGDTSDGIMLILTMEDRSFDILARAGYAETVFTPYVREQMASRVVSGNLRYDQYYEGFKNFIAICDEDLGWYAAGDPVTPDHDPYQEAIDKERREREEKATRTGKAAATAGIPFITSLLTVLGFKARNKTEGIKHEADDYIPKNGIRLYTSSDIFLYRSESRTKIHTDDDRGGGGSSFSSSSSSFGGHTSGHF